MKIAIIGAHGCAKTLLAQKIHASFPQSTLLPEAVRTMAVPVNEATTLQAQRAIIDKQIALEQTTAPLLICDRSVLDNYAYLYNAVQQHDEQTYVQVLAHIHTYDLFVHMTPLHPLQDDGFRSTCASFQHIIHERIHILLEENKHLLPKVMRFEDKDIAHREVVEYVRTAMRTA